MLQQLERWNQKTKRWLWLMVIIGLVAAIPVAVQRVQTERSANQVEIVFNYRNLVDMSALASNVDEFIDTQLERLQEAGVHTMALFESKLPDLEAAHRLTIYNSKEVAALQSKLPPINENYTYILFTSSENKQRLSPMIEKTFLRLGIEVHPWKFRNRDGLILKMPVESAKLKPMLQDPIAVEKLRSKGFSIMPRLADHTEYDQTQMDEWLQYYQSIGVKRIIFDGDAVKGFNNDEEMSSLARFAELLNKYHIGFVTIEGLKKQQQGMNKLAFLTDYNVIRLHSIHDQDAFDDIDVLADRLSLATKDRNIRILYLNAAAKQDLEKSEFVTPIDNLIHTLKAPGDAIASMEKNGFTMGEAIPFQVVRSSWQKIVRPIVVIGGIALIAIMISYFIPHVMLLAFVFGLMGSAGLYVLKPALFEQVLALGVAISSPTIAMVLAVRKLETNSLPKDFKVRFGKAIGLFLRTTMLSWVAIPFVIAVLNNMTYTLVLNQFRGVSLLHLVPILLTAMYIFLYRGTSVRRETKRLLKMPITVLGIFVLGVIALIGLYYLSRTGNEGDVSSIEKSFRAFLEGTFGVRPRNKEFLVAHPLFIIVAFAACRYRIWRYAFLVAVIGQLSMVDTFAHIHTPVIMSAMRTLLGLSFGLIIGIIGIFVAFAIERCGESWFPKLQQ